MNGVEYDHIVQDGLSPISLQNEGHYAFLEREQFQSTEQFIEALNRSGLRYIEANNLPAAENYFKQADYYTNSHADNTFQSDITRLRLRVATLTNLGSLYKQLGHYTTSLSCFRTALAIEDDLEGPSISTLTNLGAVLISLKQYSESVHISKRALKLLYPVVIPLLQTEQQHPDTGLMIVCQHNLAFAQENSSDPIERSVDAIESYRLALQYSTAFLGVSHPTTIYVENSYRRAMSLKMKTNPKTVSNRPRNQNSYKQFKVTSRKVHAPRLPALTTTHKAATTYPGLIPMAPVSPKLFKTYNNKLAIQADGNNYNKPFIPVVPERPPFHPTSAWAINNSSLVNQSSESPHIFQADGVPTSEHPTPLSTTKIYSNVDIPQNQTNEVLSPQKVISPIKAQPIPPIHKPEMPRPPSEKRSNNPRSKQFSEPSLKDSNDIITKHEVEPNHVTLSQKENIEVENNETKDTNEAHSETKQQVSNEVTQQIPAEPHKPRLPGARFRQKQILKEKNLVREENEERRKREEERIRKYKERQKQIEKFHKNRSAKVIQRQYRSYRTHVKAEVRQQRRLLRKKQTESARKIQRCVRKWLKRTNYKRNYINRYHHVPYSKVVKSASIIQRFYRNIKAKIELEKRKNVKINLKDEKLIREKRRSAATVIQSLVRGWMSRRRVLIKKWLRIRNACITIWNCWTKAAPRLLAIRKFKEDRARKLKAVITIQRVWRGWLGRLHSRVLIMKSRIDGIRNKEKKSAEAIQRCFRCHKSRKILSHKRKSANDIQNLDQINSSILCDMLQLSNDYYTKMKVEFDESEARLWLRTRLKDYEQQKEMDRTMYLTLVVDKQGEERRRLAVHHPTTELSKLKAEIKLKEEIEKNQLLDESYLKHSRDMKLKLNRQEAAATIQRQFRISQAQEQAKINRIEKQIHHQRILENSAAIKIQCAFRRWWAIQILYMKRKKRLI